MQTCSFKSKKEGKDQKLIQSSTTPDQGHHMKSNKITIHVKHHTQESQEVSPFPAGNNKATANRQET